MEDKSDAPFSIVAQATEKSSIQVLSPNGGEQWKAGETHTITWTSAGYPSDTPVQIWLLDTRYSSELGLGGLALKSTTIGAGSYTFVLPTSLQYLSNGSYAGNVYKVRVSITASSLGTKDDSSDTSFSIVAAGTPSSSISTENNFASALAAIQAQLNAISEKVKSLPR